MTRCYLQYQLIIEEPVILSDGSQIGNILKTNDYIPGSTILGVCADLYARAGKAITHNEKYTDDFRSLFLSNDTLYSPSYSLASYDSKFFETFPMPLSVFGCKYFGTQKPYGKKKENHGFNDCLFSPVPPKCHEIDCNAALENKSGYCFEQKGRWGFCNHEVQKQILTHNQVGEKKEEKSLFSLECISEGQIFYGEIAFRNTKDRDLIKSLIMNHPVVKIGKTKNRGKGKVKFEPTAIKENAESIRKKNFSNGALADKPFSITFFSDAIILDHNLNYASCLQEDVLARAMKIENSDELIIHQGLANSDQKSFFKNAIILGFNQHRRMPLPMEKTIVKGSVFTVTYTGQEDIREKLNYLMCEGIGIRKNEGFGMVIVNHRIHQKPPLTTGAE